MAKDKQKYEPPKAMRLDDKELGKGWCDPSGSGDAYCWGSGSSATYQCIDPGSSAAEVCSGTGNSVS